MFDHPAFDGHEGVHLFHDDASGLRCVIAIHSTARGPSAGGTRMWNYASGADMMTDALRLSQGMSFKNAMADIPFGGGKAVIWGDSKRDKTEALFEAFGRAVDSLHGAYYTAEDVGISPSDIEIAARETRYAAGLSQDGAPGSGDPSPITARGVFMGIKLAAERVFGSSDLSNRSIAVQGVGHVGAYLCDHLAEAGAHLILTDVDQTNLEAVAKRCGARTVDPDEIYSVDADIFSPNALGAIVNPRSLSRFKFKVIAGGANNQLETLEMGAQLRDAGILYVPDYVINAGGIINVAGELSGEYTSAWVDRKLVTLMQTLSNVLDVADQSGEPTNTVADRIARQRIEDAKPNAL